MVLVAVPDRSRTQAVGGPEASGGHDPLDRVPPLALVLTGIVSVQFGASLAIGLFDELGPAGTVLLRVAFGALILTAVVRPRWRGYGRGDVALLVAFGLTLGSHSEDREVSDIRSGGDGRQVTVSFDERLEPVLALIQGA